MVLNYIQHTDITLRTLSPLHIGNGNKLSSVGDYLVTNHRVCYLDEKRLLIDLDKSGKTTAFTEKLRQFRSGFDFEKSLSELGVSYTDYQTKEIPLNQFGLKVKNNNILYPCVRTQDAKTGALRPYVPGSTLKGLLRTAIVFKYFLDHPSELSHLEDSVERRVEQAKNLRKALSDLWQKIKSDILPEELFQSIRLTDSKPFQETEEVIEYTRRQHFYGVDTEGLGWLSECVCPGVESSFDLTYLSGFRFDKLPKNPKYQKGAFKYLKSTNPRHIFSALNQHSKLLVEQEMDLLKQAPHAASVRDKLLVQLAEYKALIDASDHSYAISRIGKGKTLFFITILPLLSKSLQKKVLQRLLREGSDTIQSRVVTTVDPKLFGWIRLEKEIPPVPLPNNQVAEIIPEKTKLTVLVSGNKQVSFQLNSESFEGVQLIDPYKRKPREGEQITVTVWRLKKDDTINQVKYL
ncbi:MAG: type III-A CRISPR-associated RAMP protein Csm5 [Bacteroidota bacterium]